MCLLKKERYGTVISLRNAALGNIASDTSAGYNSARRRNCGSFFRKLAGQPFAMTIEEKALFLQSQFIPLLQALPTETHPVWGKMTLQQMVEHFSDSVRMASGKVVYLDIVTPPEQLEKARSFLESEKPFRENTKNSLMPEVPAPVRNPSFTDAIKELRDELHFFFAVFEENNMQVTRNPFFGDLNYEQNIQLLHKHAIHHLKQFGITINEGNHT